MHGLDSTSFYVDLFIRSCFCHLTLEMWSNDPLGILVGTPTCLWLLKYLPQPLISIKLVFCLWLLKYCMLAFCFVIRVTCTRVNCRFWKLHKLTRVKYCMLASDIWEFSCNFVLKLYLNNLRCIDLFLSLLQCRLVSYDFVIETKYW